MESLKWIGSLILSAMGLAASVAIGFFLASFGALLGLASMVVGVVVIVAMFIKEYFWPHKEPTCDLDDDA